MSSEVVITFKSAAVKERFLGLNAITIDNQSYAIQDIDRPLTFLTVYDASFELSDWAIIKRLTPFCEVVNYRRGKFDFAPGVYNGLRHYRVRIIKPIPNFLRFGRYQVFLKYAGQPPTCRRCNLPGHFSNVCDRKVCFNCQNIGHEANSCPGPPLCNFCKEDGHLSKDCRYSWVSPIFYGEPMDESTHVDIDDESDVSEASFKTHSGDSFRWADESDHSDAYLDVAENLPLAAALPSDAQQPFPIVSVDQSASSPTPTAETPVLFESSESLPNAQPVHLPSADSSPDADPQPIDSQSEHVLDSQGLIKPDVIFLDDAPAESSPAKPSTSSVARPRITRRTPAPIPEALTAAALRKPTSPSLVSGKSRSSVPPSSPMDTSCDLKCKGQTQTDATPKEKRKQKKCKKSKD